MSSGKQRNVVSLSTIKIPEWIGEFVSVQNETAVCASLQIAEKFEIEHKSLMRTIDELVSEGELICLRKKEIKKDRCGPAPIFDCFKSEYLDIYERKQPMYYLNLTGFMLVGMRHRSEGARKWRRKFVEAFQTVTSALLETANERIVKLTPPKESIWMPVYNEWNNQWVPTLVPADLYTDDERLVIRKANSDLHERKTRSNRKKWERWHLEGQSALSFMPVVNCEMKPDGTFVKDLGEKKLRIQKLPKFPVAAFRKSLNWLKALKS